MSSRRYRYIDVLAWGKPDPLSGFGDVEEAMMLASTTSMAALRKMGKKSRFKNIENIVLPFKERLQM